MLGGLQRTQWPGTTPLRRKKPVATVAKARPAAKAPAPARAKLATFTPTAPVASPNPNPGPSAGGEAQRNAATGTYQTTVADINRQLLQAALQYGGVGQVQNIDPGTGGYANVDVSPNDPLSSMAEIGRTLQTNTKGLNDELTRNNTFFSGQHLTRQQEIDDLANRDRTDAQRQYENAVAQLLGQGGQALGERDLAYANARQSDIDRAAGQAPIATASSAGNQSSTGGSSKYPFVQKTGPNAGIAYAIVLKNGKRYKQYSDGRPPVPA
jgi:hypothetical protein